MYIERTHLQAVLTVHTALILKALREHADTALKHVTIAEMETMTMAHVNHGGLGREQDHADVLCRRLLFRSWNRGTQESDLILGSFTEASLPKFDGIQLDRLEALLDCSDPDLFDWIFGVTPPPAQHDHDVLRLLRDFCIARQIIPRPQ